MCPDNATMQKQEEQMATVFKEEETEKTLMADPLQDSMEKQADPQQKMADALMAQEQKEKDKTKGAAAPAPPVQTQKHKNSFKEKRARKKQEKQAVRQEIQRQQDVEVQILQMEQRFQAQQPELDGLMGDQYTEWEKNATEEEKRAFSAYSGEFNISYHTMNSVLREKTYQRGGGIPRQELEDQLIAKGKLHEIKASLHLTKENHQATTDIIDAINRTELPKDLVFRRGANFSTIPSMLNLPRKTTEQELLQQLNKINDGSQLAMDRAFLSTSPYKKGGFNKAVNYLIQAHKGDKALYMEKLSGAPDEKESLFQAGTQFKVIKVIPPVDDKGNLMNGKWNVYLETIPGVEAKCGNP